MRVPAACSCSSRRAAVQSTSTLPYMSKLDQFDDFVAHTKLAPLHLQPASVKSPGEQQGLSQQASQHSGEAAPQHSLVLVRDLPFAVGVYRDRLLESLGELPVLAQCSAASL